MADYSYWQNALKGEFGPVHDSDPQPGYYRRRTRKSGPYVPAAIWEADPTTGLMVAIVDGKEADAAEQWSYLCRYPIPEAWYHDKMAGKPWPDEDATVSESLIGHNNGPTDPAEILKEQIESAVAGADAYAKVADDETASKAQSLRSRLLELSREADKVREAQKAPHLEAGRVVDALYQPMVKTAKGAADAIAKAIGAHETAKARETAKAAAEAERLRLETLKAQEADAPLLAPIAPPATEPVPAPSLTVRGAYGRAATVKTVKIASVSDQDAAYSYFKTQPEIIEVIAKLAQKAVTAGLTPPGVTITEEKKVI